MLSVQLFAARKQRQLKKILTGGPHESNMQRNQKKQRNNRNKTIIDYEKEKTLP